MRAVDKIGRRLRRTADAAQLGDHVRLRRNLPECADDGGGNRVVPAARAQRGHCAFVVANGHAQVVALQTGMSSDGFCDGWHGYSSISLVGMLARAVESSGVSGVPREFRMPSTT